MPEQSDFDKVVTVLGEATKLITMGIEQGHVLFSAGSVIVTLAERIQRGDLPTDEEVIAAVGRSKIATNDLLDAINKSKERNG